MIDLGTLGGSHSVAYAINKSGEVAGSSGSASGEAHAVLWTDGRTVDLTVGSGGRDLCGCHGIALDVNDHGQVVGFEYRFLPPGPPYYGALLADALLWANGTRTLIAAGDDSSSYIARRIGERGEVSGTRTANLPGGLAYGFFWEAGALVEWTLGSWWLSTDAMNKVGQVVGAGRTPDGGLHGYVWQGGRLTDFGEEITEVSDINEQGLVVGTLSFDSPGAESHAALFTPVGH
jgi:probable HAF family extracellular repeat protein